MSFSHLRRLERNPLRVSVPTDEHGLTGRECPNPECLGYFKIKFGTGLKGEDLPCHCPYCGHTEGQDHFWTQEQLNYAQSLMVREVQKALAKDVKDWDRKLRSSTRRSFVKLSVSYKGTAQPIRYYREKELETAVTCDNCTLEYAVYGVFAYCPDCGIHNSLQILKKNFELAEKELGMSETTDDADFSAYLVADALENAVSAFDGFGREVCLVFADKASDPEKAKSVSFQNPVNAKQKITNLFGYDLAAPLGANEWDFVVRCFQKRHLLAHRLGVIDQRYIDVSQDHSAVVGRKIRVESMEVRQLMEALLKIGSGLIAHLQKP